MRTKINIGAWGLSCIWWVLAIVKLIMYHEYRGYMALTLGACISALMMMYNYIALKEKIGQCKGNQNKSKLVTRGMTKYMSETIRGTESNQSNQRVTKKM